MSSEARWELRRATDSDLEFLERLRNDEVSARFSRRGVLSADVIRREFLFDAQTTSFVCRCGPNEVGYARFDLAADRRRSPGREPRSIQAARAEVSIALAPECRGQGLGAGLVIAATEFAFRRWPAALVQTLEASVHRDNAASLRCFERAGYSGFGGSNSGNAEDPFRYGSRARAAEVAER